MTTVRWGQIHCNGCGRQGPLFRAMAGDPGARAARQALRKRGWRRIPGSVGRGADICSGCLPKYPGAR